MQPASSNTQCLAAKHNLFFDVNQSVKLCCNSHQTLPLANPAHLTLASTDAAAIQHSLDQNQRHPNCQVCWREEQNHGRSLRQSYNDMYPDFDSDTSLRTVHIQYDNTCNLNCVYCGPRYSTIWAAHRRVPLPSRQVVEFDNDILKELKSVTLAGGEPTLVKSNIDLLTKLRHINPQCEIVVNSNLTYVDQSLVFENLKYFENVTVIASFESTGRYYEYIRHSAKWEDFTKNFSTLRARGHTMQASMVFFPLSACDIPNAINWALDHTESTNIFLNDYEGDQLDWSHISQKSVDKLKDKILKYSEHVPSSVSKQLKNKTELMHSQRSCTELPMLAFFDTITKVDNKILFSELYE